MTDGTEPAIRASNREREAVIARLNAAVGEGRLDIEEFSERVEVAYASRTRQELEPLTADLPATTDRTPVPSRPYGRRYRLRQLRVRYVTQSASSWPGATWIAGAWHSSSRLYVQSVRLHAPTLATRSRPPLSSVAKNVSQLA